MIDTGMGHDIGVNKVDVTHGDKRADKRGQTGTSFGLDAGFMLTELEKK